MNNSNNFRVTFRIKYSDPGESARQEFAAATAQFAPCDAARPAVLKYLAQKEARQNTAAETDRSQQNRVATPLDMDAHAETTCRRHWRLVRETCYDAQGTQTRNVLIPLEDHAEAHKPAIG